MGVGWEVLWVWDETSDGDGNWTGEPFRVKWAHELLCDGAFHRRCRRRNSTMGLLSMRSGCPGALWAWDEPGDGDGDWAGWKGGRGGVCKSKGEIKSLLALLTLSTSFIAAIKKLSFFKKYFVNTVDCNDAVDLLH